MPKLPVSPVIFHYIRRNLPVLPVILSRTIKSLPHVQGERFRASSFACDYPHAPNVQNR